QDFLRDFGATQDVELDCLRRQALLQTGQQQQALNGIESIWLSAYSRPDACDPVFAVWRQQGGYTQARIWHRFELSMQAGQTGLARYLRGLLRGRQQQLADLWLAVHARPELVLDRARFARLDEITARIVLHGLTRWSSRDSVEAAAAFDRLQQLLQFPPSAELDALQQRLALFVASRGDPSAVRRLAELPPRLVNEAVDEWRVRTALQRGDWAGVLHWTEAMQPASREQLAWRYWRARALEQRGQTAAANT
ncbi:MAG: lytic murein transglycosylase, partial [Candidatus Competibacteraceae bacterium]|nr:lytic murein transglycosylase [Candidatus Competibacteraceae bacterium]